jgi:hypothetical protein
MGLLSGNASSDCFCQLFSNYVFQLLFNYVHQTIAVQRCGAILLQRMLLQE